MSSMPLRRVVVLGLASAFLLPLTGASGQSAGDGNWRHARVWDDGKAEFCSYDVTWPRYGDLYPGKALLILVKEPWAPDLDVKADRPRSDGFDVLKLNHVRDVRTGIYAYHQMVSIFFRRDDGRVRKLASTSSEACGITTTLMKHGDLEVHSYFDEVGDRHMPYPEGALPEDGLPASLRDYVTGPRPAFLSILPTLLDGKLADLRPRRMRLTRSDAGFTTVPAGRFAAVELRLQDQDRLLTYRFDHGGTHRLVEMEISDGTVYRLRKCQRLAYWTLHGKGGEKWYGP